MTRACAPSPRSSTSKALPSASWRPDVTTLAPSLAKASAVARPMPVKAPVIRTTGLLLIFRSSQCAPLQPAEHGQEENLGSALGTLGVVPSALRHHIWGAPARSKRLCR